MLKTKGSNISAMIGLDKEFPSIEVSRLLLDFSGVVVPLNAEVSDKLYLTCKSGKIKYTFVLPTKDPRYELRVTPANGKLKVRPQILSFFLFFLLFSYGKLSFADWKATKGGGHRHDCL